jgi:hypothetical protein
MFCPKCGAADQSVDSYCKRCGEWLPDTSHLGRRRGRLTTRTPEQRNQKMRVLEAASFLAALASAFIIGAFVSGKLEKPALIIALDLSVITAVFQIVNFIIGRSLQKRLKQGRDDAEKDVALQPASERFQLQQADTSNLVQPASVTENTTAILEPIPRRARGEERGDR